MRYPLEAVTICCGYDDFLAAIIPYNLPMFDRWVIVTAPTDIATRELCRRYGLECLLTEDGHDHGEFAKGRMIERGLQHLTASGWRLHMDADMILPRHFRKLMEMAELQTDMIYGVDRIMVKSWEDWQKFKTMDYLEGGQYTYSCSVNFSKSYALGSRWASVHTGYVPIGAFQMWHSDQDLWRGIRVKPYPKQHNDACRTDIQHGLQWDRKKRALIPEIVAVHLESEPAAVGANWRGRKTKRFGPDMNFGSPQKLVS